MSPGAQITHPKTFLGGVGGSSDLPHCGTGALEESSLMGFRPADPYTRSISICILNMIKDAEE